MSAFRRESDSAFPVPGGHLGATNLSAPDLDLALYIFHTRL